MVAIHNAQDTGRNEQQIGAKNVRNRALAAHVDYDTALEHAVGLIGHDIALLLLAGGAVSLVLDRGVGILTLVSRRQSRRVDVAVCARFQEVDL